MPLRILFEGSVPKHADAPGDNEDAYRVDAGQGRIVLSDGASESFDARTWARLLVERLANSEPSPEAIEACTQDYEREHDPSTLSWSKLGAYERGSFATMLIAQDFPDQGLVRVQAMGDTLAAWVEADTLLATSPYARSDQFADQPTLLASRRELNASSSDDGWSAVEWAYPTAGYRLLLCMTDALGAWLLRRQEEVDPSGLETISRIRDLQELIDLVETERAACRLRRDDTTLIVACVTQD